MAQQVHSGAALALSTRERLMEALTSTSLSTEDGIDLLYAATEPHAIRIRHDQHECAAPNSSAVQTSAAPNTSAVQTSAVPTSESPTSAAQHSSAPTSAKTPKSQATGGGRALAPHLIYARDGTLRLTLDYLFDDGPKQPAPERGRSVCRLLLSGGRNRSAIQREFIGLVFDARTWQLLVAPPPAFNLRPAAREVDALLAENAYECIRVEDGTVVTLYCWNHPQLGATWALATSNGYDVSSLYWMGPKTYSEVVFDLMTRLHPEFIAVTGAALVSEAGLPRLTFTSLDPGHSYTFGFRHHDFHPIRSDPERVWQIQAAPNAAAPGAAAAALVGGAAGLPAVPFQTVVAQSALACELGLANPFTLAQLRATGTHAFETAAAHISGAAVVSPAALAFNYGWILRLKPDAGLSAAARALAAAHADHTHVLVETPLLVRVRRTIYERAPRSVRDNISATERFDYNAMRAFLMPSAGDYLTLFPAQASLFTKYRKFMDELVGEAVEILQQRARAPAHEPRPATAAGRIAHELLKLLKLLKRTAESAGLTKDSRDVEGILRDFIMVPANAYLFLRAVNLKAE